MIIDFIIRIEKIAVAGDVQSCAQDACVLIGSVRCVLRMRIFLKNDEYLPYDESTNHSQSALLL